MIDPTSFLLFVLFAVFMVVFGAAKLIYNRRRLSAQILEMWSSVILIGLTILFRIYGLIPSIVGDALVALAILLLSVSIYTFVRKE